MRERLVGVRPGGIATGAGYVLVFALLFRHPIRAFDAVNADVPGTVYFVGFPAAGVLTGVWAARELPGAGPALLVTGPTLVGFATLRPIGPIEAELPVGAALALLFGLGAVGTVGGAVSVWASFQQVIG